MDTDNGVYFLMAVLVTVVLFLSGCATKTEWYENGQVKSHRTGFIEFSNGVGKNLPLSNPSISVIGK
jgi:hypothetical protein